MKETKKETKKTAEEKATPDVKKVKITKPNGNVIVRDNYDGLSKQYESKGCKVEEV
tara:strand:+ start:105 stop:272 length:168 start_codon:yes stop_codon:yes gene_type:complete